MKIAPLSVFPLFFACVVACGPRQATSASHSSQLASTPQHTALVAAVQGCYPVTSAKIVESASAEHPAIARVLLAQKLCLSDTLQADGGTVSRSGRVAVTAYEADSETVVGGTWGFGVAAEQPRCLGCYVLSGFDGRLEWNGEAQARDAAAPISVTLNLRNLFTTYELTLGARLD